ncbi:MAG: DUF2946 family protein [Paracraurococcus sp.]
MARRATALRLLLVLLLSVQWGSAFAHCLAPLGTGGHAVEICTADGIRTVVLGADGQPQAPAGQTHDSCPLCPGSAAPGPEAPTVAALPIRWIAAAQGPHAAGLPPCPARAPPQQPRAPPFA